MSGPSPPGPLSQYWARGRRLKWITIRYHFSFLMLPLAQHWERGPGGEGPFMHAGTNSAIVGGLGHLGARIAAMLCERGYAVTGIALSVDDETRQSLEALGCRILLGDLRSDPLLDAAGITEADCCLFVSGDDRANLEAAISARTKNPQVPVILRLFDLDLARRVEQALGVRAFSTSALASPAFVSAATDDDIIAVFNIAGCRVTFSLPGNDEGTVVPLVLGGDAVRPCGKDERPTLVASLSGGGMKRKRPHAGRPARRPLHGVIDLWRHASSVTRGLLITFTAVVLLGVLVFWLIGGLTPLDALYFMITTVTTTGYGDFNLQHASGPLKVFGIFIMLTGAALLATLYALIADHVLTARVEALLGRRRVNLRGHTVVVGLGNVGFRVAQDLAALGIPLAAVEASEDSDNVHAARSLFPVIIGSAARASVLQKAGVEDAAMLLALTDDPMLNLSIALHASERNPDIKTIVRTFEVNLAAQFKSFGLFNAISTSAIAAPVFVDAAITPGVYGSFTVDGTDVLVVRHRVNEHSPLCGRTAGEIGRTDGIAAILASDDGKTFHAATAETVLHLGACAVLLLSRVKLPVLCRTPVA